MEHLVPLIPSSAWAHTPWPVTVAVFVFMVGGVIYFPRILAALTGWEGATIKASGQLQDQAMRLADGAQGDLVEERVARIAARRDADRGWWLARHWYGVAWGLLEELRRSVASLRVARMTTLTVIEKWNACHPDKPFLPPEWAVLEDGHMRPVEIERPADLVKLEAPQPPDFSDQGHNEAD